MDFLKGDPKLARVELHSSVSGTEREDLTDEECVSNALQIAMSVRQAIINLDRTKGRLALEYSSRELLPEHFREEGQTTNDRLALEKDQLQLLLEQLDAVWERFPGKLKTFYKDDMLSLRTLLENGIRSGNLKNTSHRIEEEDKQFLQKFITRLEQRK